MVSFESSCLLTLRRNSAIQANIETQIRHRTRRQDLKHVYVRPFYNTFSRELLRSSRLDSGCQQQPCAKSAHDYRKALDCSPKVVHHHATPPLASFRSRSNILAWILPPVETSVLVNKCVSEKTKTSVHGGFESRDGSDTHIQPRNGP